VAEPTLSVRDLAVEFVTDDGVVRAVDGVTYDVYPRETLGIVGESGSGKSVSQLAILGLIPRPPGRIVRGEALLNGQNTLKMSKKRLRRIRGGDVAMVFQDPMTSLNPVLKVGKQIGEAIRAHNRIGAEEARKRAIRLLALVGIPNPEQRFGQYPHEFSGGMRQRAMIAMAIANEPKLLIADEPTTALDVTIQAQILALIVDLQKTLGTGLILITHDLGVVAQTAQRVIVMYAGKNVEEATVEDLFANPKHPYTRGLMASMPAVISFGTKTDARLTEIPGMVPSLTNLPPGCAFAPRCSLAIDRCRAEYPPLQEVDGDHFAACWRAAELVGAP
jgi:peptide/nickel transport system ATP-binding protein